MKTSLVDQGGFPFFLANEHFPPIL